MWYQALSLYQEVIVIYSWENDAEEPVCQRFLHRLHPHKSKLIHGTASPHTLRQADILVQKHPDVYYVYQQVVVVNKGCLQIQHLLRVNSLKRVNKKGTNNKAVMALTSNLKTNKQNWSISGWALRHSIEYFIFQQGWQRCCDTWKVAIDISKSYLRIFNSKVPSSTSHVLDLPWPFPAVLLMFWTYHGPQGRTYHLSAELPTSNLKSDLIWFLLFILVVLVPSLYKEGPSKLIATLAGEIGPTSEHRFVMTCVMQPTISRQRAKTI